MPLEPDSVPATKSPADTCPPPETVIFPLPLRCPAIRFLDFMNAWFVMIAVPSPLFPITVFPDTVSSVPKSLTSNNPFEPVESPTVITPTSMDAISWISNVPFLREATIISSALTCPPLEILIFEFDPDSVSIRKLSVLMYPPSLAFSNAASSEHHHIFLLSNLDFWPETVTTVLPELE